MVTLRKYNLSDSALLAEYIGNPNVLINLSDEIPKPYTQKDAEEFIKKSLNEGAFRFAIEYNGNYCGGIGLDKILGHCGHDKAMEIGYWLAESFWNKGITTEAVKQVCELGFKELNLVRIEANVFEYNKASMSVLEKCGFKKEGIQRKGAIKNGKIVNSHRYSIVK